MKKITAFFMAGIMCFLLVACDENLVDENTDFVGEWKAVSVDTAGKDVSAVEQQMIEKMLEAYNVSVQDDKTAVFSRGDKEENMKAEWEADENTITFFTDVEGTVTGELKDGKLVLNMDSQAKLIFEKKQ